MASRAEIMAACAQLLKRDPSVLRQVADWYDDPETRKIVEKAFQRKRGRPPKWTVMMRATLIEFPKFRKQAIKEGAPKPAQWAAERTSAWLAEHGVSRTRKQVLTAVRRGERKPR
jgi:hypothetical protein